MSLRTFLSRYELTRVETELVEMLMTGMSNQEMATERNRTIKTIKTHLAVINKKMDVETRYKLMYKCAPYVDWTGRSM